MWLLRPAATRAGGDRPQQARAVGDPALPGLRAPLKRRHRRALHDGLRRPRSGDRHRPLPGDPRLDRRVLGPRRRPRPQAADVLRQSPGRGVLRALPGTDLQPRRAAAADSDQRRTARRGRAVPRGPPAGRSAGRPSTSSCSIPTRPSPRAIAEYRSGCCVSCSPSIAARRSREPRWPRCACGSRRAGRCPRRSWPTASMRSRRRTSCG